MADSWWKQIPHASSIDEQSFQLFTAEGKPIVGAIYSKRQQPPVHRLTGSVQVGWSPKQSYTDNWVSTRRMKRKVRLEQPRFLD